MRPDTFSPAEAQFEEILRSHSFMTASLKRAVQAPSIEDGAGLYVILPDILAIDPDGVKGWCFEVKDEATSSYKMRQLEMTKGYSGPAWFLRYRKALGYLNFSKAFDCPCVIAIHTKAGWRAGFFTRRADGQVDYNRDIVVPGWKDPGGIPVLFGQMQPLRVFFESIRTLQKQFWQ